MCDGLLTRQGLVLPTEAQWEYGCRGETTTPWVCNRAALKDYANLADLTAKRAIEATGVATGSTFEEWTDAHPWKAPVGSFQANQFGLHDVHGNVLEWCLDEYGSYEGPLRAGDGLQLEGYDSSVRVDRGGSCGFAAILARSAIRSRISSSVRGFNLGLRPARAARVPD